MHFFVRMRRFWRNINLDAWRINSIRVAFRAAISDAERELERLAARVQQYTDAAAHAFDDAPDLSLRTPQEEYAIACAEKALITASKRQQALINHITCLRRASQSAEALFAIEDQRMSIS
jgi:hypothetical protein